MTQEQAAKSLDMSASALSRKENGDVAATVHEVRSMMDLYDIYDPDLVELARAAKEKGWWRAYGIEDKGYVDMETEASALREFQPLHIPGQLQTETYMRWLFAGNPGLTSREVDTATTVRLERQHRLTDDEHPLTIHTIISEGALTRTVGGPEVMRAQLHHLVDRNELPNVAIQILPRDVGVVRGLDGSFTVLAYSAEDQHDILYVEHVGGAVHTEKLAEVQRAANAFEELQAVALCSQESVRCIQRIATSL